MSRLLLLTVFLALAGCVSDQPENAVKPDPSLGRMNLIMICLDTLRSDRMGGYGHDTPTTPFLDALSRHAVLATDVLAQNPSTIRSHRAIFTGLYVYQQTVEPAAASTTLAGRFADAGYKTAAFTDGGLMNAIWGNNPGFQVYNDEAGGSVEVFRRGLDWIDQNSTDPFFVFLHTYDIHYPYTPPAPFDGMFLPKGDPPYHLGGDHGQDYWNRLDLVRDEFIWISRRYDGGVRRTDADMMDFWSELQRRNLLDNTMVVVLSDHGESLGERLFVGHRDVYDVQLKVPLILYRPGYGRHVLDGAVETVDILPTLLDLFAIGYSDAFPGFSLASAIRNQSALSHMRPRLSETWARAFRLGPDWKLILRENIGKDELFQMENDPEEMASLTETQAEMAETLRKALIDFTGIPPEKIREVQQQRHQVPVMLMSENDAGEENTLMKQLRELGYIQ